MSLYQRRPGLEDCHGLDGMGRRSWVPGLGDYVLAMCARGHVRFTAFGYVLRCVMWVFALVLVWACEYGCALPVLYACAYSRRV